VTEAPAPAPAPASSVRVGGYIQPQFRIRQNSPAQFDTDGFRFARARVIALGQTRVGELELSGTLEAELQPSFFLADGYVTASHALPGNGRLSFDLGQMRVPVSRQNLLSDSRLAFVDKAQLATIAPGRDLGLRATFVVPKLPQVRLLAGVFNGEGINNVENINEKFLYAGRLEVTPVGQEPERAEGGLGPAFLTLAASAGYNVLTAGDRLEDAVFLGADLAFRYRGLSGTFEYLEVRHTFTTDLDPAALPPDFKANGLSGQLNYLLPVTLPYRDLRLELGARYEEIDRNDTVPIAQPGDPEQSVRAITGVASLYLRSHSLKAQLAFTHFTELEDRTALNEDAAYDNDQLLLQVTYRLE
jgi:hypothetical protein